MSVKKAQNIVNQVEDRLGISLVSYQNNELEWLKDQLESFLEQEVETEELADPSDLDFEGSDEDDTEELNFNLGMDYPNEED